MDDETRDALRRAGAEDGRRSRVRQGLPERIEDPTAASSLAALLRGSYAEQVVRVLREHFPDMDDLTSGVIREAVERWMRSPQTWLEVIVDNPISANWRLRERGRQRPGVRLACYRMTHRESDAQMERTVNDALSALEV